MQYVFDRVTYKVTHFALYIPVNYPRIQTIIEGVFTVMFLLNVFFL